MELVISLPSDSNLPVYKKVSDGLREAILSGRLKPGEKLPSTRELADSLHISRFTVIRSYEELISQGYIVTSSGSGTYVNPTLAVELLVKQRERHDAVVAHADPSSIQLSEYGERVMHAPEIESAYVELFKELNYYAPSIDQLPLTNWRKALYKSSRFDNDESLIYVNDPFGYRPLREAIASFLARSRSCNCSADQICIFSGTQNSLDLIGRLLVDKDDLVALEDPGFPGARRSMLMQGGSLLPIHVDKDGLVVDELERIPDKIKLVYITPSHETPLGVVMSLDRRKQLLNWAHKTGTFILEDDFDNEFRYAGKPTPALQGLDQGDSVIYMASFWKILYPVLRLSYMILPKRLVPIVERAKSLIERDLPLLEQKALADFITEGHLERYIKRTRELYGKRRVALIHALTKHFGKRAAILDSTSGMDMVVRFNVTLDEDKMLEMAQQAKISLVSTRPYYLDEPTAHEFIMGFGHLDVEHIENSIGQFAALVNAAGPELVNV
jgi:GntR family transcriptional regulator/MocR family aminotransferase